MNTKLSTEGIDLLWQSPLKDKLESAPGTSYLRFLSGKGVVVFEPAKTREQGFDPDSSVTDVEASANKTLPASAKTPIKPIPRTHQLGEILEDRYILLKKYEGFVTEVGSDSFSARLTESIGDHPVIVAEFDLEEISEVDRNRLVEGAPLVWTIGYRYQGSTRHRDSFLYLRNLPQWTEEEIAKARETTEKLTSGIKWE